MNRLYFMVLTLIAFRRGKWKTKGLTRQGPSFEGM